MKKKDERKDIVSRVKKAKEDSAKIESIKDCCREILSTFNYPARGYVKGQQLSELIYDMVPWEGLFSKNYHKRSTNLFEAMQLCFGFGFAVGKMLDVPGLNITPIENLLREKESLLYFPHKRKAA